MTQYRYRVEWKPVTGLSDLQRLFCIIVTALSLTSLAIVALAVIGSREQETT